MDPLPLAQDLLRCASVTPADAGAQDVLAAALTGLGFTVTRLKFGEIENLFAEIGTDGPHFCFAGHTDVVPPGNANWKAAPFAGEVRDGVLYGRGACDMKGGIAAFVAGAADYLAAGGSGKISLLITGDEEGPAVDGTVKVLDWMAAHGKIPDFCLVGEPTNPTVLGEMIKVGRRGSINATITVHGTQGHVAYPHRVDNPVHRLVRALDALIAAPIDAGSEFFEPTSIQVTSIDVGNKVTNLVPDSAQAMLNIRFNERHTGAALAAWIRATVARYAERFNVDIAISGESFLTAPGPVVDRVCRAIAASTGQQPKLDTGGGTSDARFIAKFCPVAEFGLVGATMHQVDESVPLADLRALAGTYRAVLDAFFAA